LSSYSKMISADQRKTRYSITPCRAKLGLDNINVISST
jgi:hypothetical protein